MSESKLQNKAMDDGKPPSERLEAEHLVDATLEGHDAAVDATAAAASAAGKVKGLVGNNGAKPAQPAERGGL